MPKVNRKPTAAEVREREVRFAKYLDAMVPIGDAIRLALSADPFDRKRTNRSIPEFAQRHGINPKLAASAIYGGRRDRANEQLCDALAIELGGTAEYWRNLLSPVRETAATA